MYMYMDYFLAGMTFCFVWHCFQEVVSLYELCTQTQLEVYLLVLCIVPYVRPDSPGPVRLSFLSPASFLYVSVFLAPFSYSVKPWPPSFKNQHMVHNSRPLSVSLSLSSSPPSPSFLCAHACSVCPLSVFPHCQQPSVWLCLPLSAALLWDQMLVFE